MSYQSDLSLLAAGSYWDVRKFSSDPPFDNRAPIPPGWELVPGYDVSRSGGAGNGFSARVYRNTTSDEVVISYAGTEFGNTFSGFVSDFISGNIPLAVGRYGAQALEAAKVYQLVKADPALSDNIRFTGHSLGGGLASVMAVWFNRPATVFAPAPFQASADVTQVALLGVSLPAMYQVKGLLLQAGMPMDPAFAAYNPLVDFATRESNVTAYAIKGELLEDKLGMFNWIEGSSTPLFNDSAITLDPNNKHSIDLHAAALLVPDFQAQAARVPNALSILMDKALYGGSVTGNQQLLITKLLRNEVGVYDGAGNVVSAPNSMLRHFTADLQKLGTNIAGLNRQAQDALVAQGIEWYYWQGTNYAGQEFFTNTGDLLQYATASGDGLAGALNKADAWVAPWLKAIAAEHGWTTGLPKSSAYAQWNVGAHATTGVTATARDPAKSQIYIGQAGADSFHGGSLNDVIFAGAGADSLNGGGGNDWLHGGAGADAYLFTGAFGRDAVADTDGVGSILIDGAAIGTARASGSRNGWAANLGSGVFAGLYVHDDASSTTGKKLVITRGADTANTITINNFDLARALGTGYLGIQLDGQPQVALVQGNAGNYWADPHATLDNLDGRTTTIAEGSGRSFSISLSMGAKAGETLVLTAAGQGGGLKAILGDTTVDANGAVITLVEGQTQVSFALVQEGELGADATGSLSVTYNGTGQTAQSNTWALTLKDAGEPDATLNGDYLVRTEKETGGPAKRYNAAGQLVTVVDTGELYYVADNQGNLVEGTSEPTLMPIYNEQGEVVGVDSVDSDDEMVTDNTLFGSAGRDVINGLSGNDLLSGLAGDDVIDGGDGDVMIAGGAGSDEIKGGAGNDYISSSADAYPGYQQLGPRDLWSNWGPQVGSEVRAYGAMWGAYLSLEQAGLTIWDGVTVPRTDAGEGDRVDAGAGDDRVIASWGDDIVDGGEGDDDIFGLAGDDILEGSAGNDMINGDGSVKAGSFGSVPSASHGADFIDGGAGDDELDGAGGADQLFGGAGKDTLFGDGSGITGSEYAVSLDAHGRDYIDGEDGDDYMEGGAGEDTLYGGSGNDVLWGDIYAAHVAEPAHNALAWADDYMDGEDGDDALVGGGGGDSLYGGAGKDILWGDEFTPGLAGEFHGADWLDGEGGDDYLEGGGRDDVLFGGTGNDTLWGDSETAIVAAAFHGSDYLDGEEGDDHLLGNGGADTLYGGAGNDTLWGDSADNDLAAAHEGADYLDGGEGDDVLIGGGGDDLLIGAQGNDALYGDAGNDQLDGGGGDDYLQGDRDLSVLPGALHGNDSLNGGEGADTLIGAGGDDVLAGGAGNDVLIGDDDLSSSEPGQLAGHDVLNGGEGDDRLVGGKGDDLLDGGAGDDTLHGGAGNDTLVGGDGNDHLLAQGGNDILDGGAGDDGYVFTAADGQVRISDSGGYNTLYLKPGLRLEDLKLSLGSLKMSFGIAGNELHLDGFDPADALHASPIQSVVFEETSQRYSMGELLQMLGFDITGTPDADFLAGTSLDDRIEALESDDVIDAGAGNDSLFGGSGNDYLDAGAGDDWLDGGTGADVMLGGMGADTYRVDDAGDLVLEASDQPAGMDDTVLAAIDYSLPANVEHLTLEGAAVAGTGNELANRITGNDQDNVLYGLDGDDTLAGGDGNDWLDAGAGNDELYAGSGASRLIGGDGNDLLHGHAGSQGALMQGGAGDDTYHLASVLDVAEETGSGSAGGTDTVVAAWVGSHTLGANLENLWLRGGGTGTGNALGNTLLGDRRANTLVGLAGNDLLDGAGLAWGAGDLSETLEADTLAGGQGDDTYRLWRGHDQVVEQAGEGHDTVLLALEASDLESADAGNVAPGSAAAFHLHDHVEDLDARESGVALTLAGNEQDNRIQGGGGADVILGGAGNDHLAGGNAGVVRVWAESGAPANLPDFIRSALPETYYDETSLAEQFGVRYDIEGVDAADYVQLSGFDFGSSRDQFWLRETLPIDVSGLVAQVLKGADDRLLGEAGDDTLDGGSGNDTLLGGAGNDVLRGGDDAHMRILVQSDETWGYIATLDLGDHAAPNNDWLDGGAGIDRMEGGSGNDTYIVDGVAAVTASPGQGLNLCDVEYRFGMDRGPRYAWTTDEVIELAGQGEDMVYASASVVLDHVETVVLAGDAAILDIDASTGAGSQRLTGNAGRNRLDGGAGDDVMAGGAGDDTYIVDSLADIISEFNAQGFDTVRTALDGYALGDHLEGLVLEGSAISGSGNAAGNLLVGNSMGNLLLAGAGDDTLAGWRGNDTLMGGAGHDTYAFARGDGVDTIIDSEGGGTLHLSGDIRYADLAFSNSGDDLVIDVNSSGEANGDRIILKDWITSGERVDALAFCADGPRSLAFTLAVAADSNSVREDATLTARGNVLANDSGSGNTVVANAGTFAGSYGTLALAANGAYTYQLNNASSAVQSLRQGQSVQDVFSYTATDALTAPGIAASRLTITVTGANDAPVLVAPQADTSVKGGQAVNIALPQAMFTDRDQGDILTWSASVQGGALPAWLSFNAATRTFGGIAPQGAQTLQLTVRATDLAGAWAQDSFELRILQSGITLTGTDPKTRKVPDGCGGWITVYEGGNDKLIASAGHDTLHGLGGNDTLDGAGGNDSLLGGLGNDVMYGGTGNDTLEGGRGTDMLYGGSGADTYLFARGDGADTIIECDSTAGVKDVLQFGAGVAADQLWWRKSGKSLEVQVIGTSDKLTIKDWYSGSSYQVEQFKLADGQTLLSSQVQQLVQAMAQFNPPRAGQTSLSSYQHRVLDNVIAANWN